jgi:hypothetical protein
MLFQSLLVGLAALGVLAVGCGQTQAGPSSDRSSEVLSATSPLQADPAAWPSAHTSTRVVWGGCATDGECHEYNFYWAPTREIVMLDGESSLKVLHEACHAHQHLAINGGAPLDPSDYDLESWYGTSEGGSFSRAVAGLTWPWSNSAINPLEDFAWTCAYWHSHAATLRSISPARYDWAATNLR